jgi:hypothetical protein
MLGWKATEQAIMAATEAMWNFSGAYSFSGTVADRIIIHQAMEYCGIKAGIKVTAENSCGDIEAAAHFALS